MTLITSHRRRSIAARVDAGECAYLTTWQAIAVEWWTLTQGWAEA